jgi:hypothetical protein
MKNCVHTLKRRIAFRSRRHQSKRTFRLCCGQLERLKPRKEISKIAFSWMKELLTEEEIAAVVFFIRFY